MPKISPATDAMIICTISPSPASRWRTVYTVAKPASMNDAVAASDLGERRARPHTPWPEVQPPPSRVP